MTKRAKIVATWQEGLWWRFGWQLIVVVLRETGETPFDVVWHTGGEA